MATLGTPQAALARRKLLTIGVGSTDDILSPLPSLRTEPNRTEPNRTEPNRTEPNRTEPYRTVPAVLPHTVLRSVGFLWLRLREKMGTS
jgi:hypothetical protein